MESVNEMACAYCNTESPFTLEGKTALVTGAGRGIGRAIAKRLVRAGARVMVNDLDEAMLLESEAQLAQPDRVRHIAGDLTDPAVPEMIVEATLAEFDSIDIIVNNAGYTWDNVIQKTTDEQFKAMLEIHLVTPFRILRAASGYIREAAKREMAASQRVMRKVVNITSIAATDGNPGEAGYSAGKAGLIGLTKTLAKEWGRYNVNVNAVGFGLIGTRLVQPLTDAGTNLEMHGHRIRLGVQPSLLDSVKSACPLGRVGTPEEDRQAVSRLRGDHDPGAAGGDDVSKALQHQAVPVEIDGQDRRRRGLRGRDPCGVDQAGHLAEPGGRGDQGFDGGSLRDVDDGGARLEPRVRQHLGRFCRRLLTQVGQEDVPAGADPARDRDADRAGADEHDDLGHARTITLSA